MKPARHGLCYFESFAEIAGLRNHEHGAVVNLCDDDDILAKANA
jgi:hypothetical protein